MKVNLFSFDLKKFGPKIDFWTCSHIVQGILNKLERRKRESIESLQRDLRNLLSLIPDHVKQMTMRDFLASETPFTGSSKKKVYRVTPKKILQPSNKANQNLAFKSPEKETLVKMLGLSPTSEATVMQVLAKTSKLKKVSKMWSAFDRHGEEY